MSLIRFTAMVLSIGSSVPGWTQVLEHCGSPVESFLESEVDQFPKGWSSHSKSDQKKAIKLKTYQILKEGESSFLRADSKNDSFTIHLGLDGLDLSKSPLLKWRWRAVELPKNAREDKSSTNDAAASLYVIWKSSVIMRVKSLKFTWSSTLAPGTHISKRFGQDHVIVLRGPESPTGQWIEESVNVRELATQHYGKDPGNPVAIAILTDSDDTKTTAKADYGKIEFCEFKADDSEQPRAPSADSTKK